MKIEYTTEFLNKEFSKFNKKYFNNELKPIKFTWSKRLKYAMGITYYNTNETNDKIITRTIRLSTNWIKTYSEFRDVFVHELCHYWVNEQITNKQIKKAMIVGNGDIFKGLNMKGNGDVHLGNWIKKANELNDKFSELLITSNGKIKGLTRQQEKQIMKLKEQYNTSNVLLF